ncbi:hypothetical protein D0469_15420 [Peribacillus saganii]|uniref:Regulatory protein YycH domain-containing protein n=1 Tax=Peribacillus saganii TaxID=2303992 RepID=A0A372LKM4_9BACI|nr:two-component system activity regulator YycH [Peribacillus saganii]RFU67283.1 hypothetical protein D0469_15420 [Peribacillus saganii]
MRIEGVKNIILTVLVATSILLTWNIWTYQPDLKQAEQNEYIQEINIRAKQDIKNIIQPSQILYHKEMKHFVSLDDKEINRVMDGLFKWKLVDFQDISHKIDHKNFTAFVHKNGNAEIKFPDPVPLRLYKNLLDLEEKEVPNGNFDRIVFNAANIKGEQSSLYFISYHSRRIYESKVNSSNLSNFQKYFFNNAKRFPEYEGYEITPLRTVFLPKENANLSTYQYIPEMLDTNKFKDALFSDPSRVKREVVSRGQQFTDGSSLMNVYDEYVMIDYVNLERRNPVSINSDELLQRSINFINDHAGWDDNFKFAGLSEAEQRVSYRLFMQGYPVFNEMGMAEIVQVWGSNRIYRYTRPFFSIDSPLPSGTSEVTDLPSAKIAIRKLDEMNLEMDAFEDITIGYKLSRDSRESRLILLEPAWYYRYGGNWGPIPFNSPSGKKRLGGQE